MLFPHLDVRGNLLAGAARAAAAGDDPAALVERVASLLELDELLDREPERLSGGERQRLALGRALCSAPRLLLLDEPLASLDQARRGRLLPMLATACEQLTVPALLVSHEPLEVQALCQEVVALDRGELLAQGSAIEVLTDPEVMPLAAARGVTNVLRATPGTARGELRVGRHQVIVAGDARETAGALIELPADRILIATEPPRGLSARNVWPATVEALVAHGDGVLASARVDGYETPLLVELTADTPEALGLAAGRAVHLVFKATSCRILG